MDGYKPRKGPNVSHFLANLNALPSAHEAATQQQDDFNLDDELAQFTNTEFLDFDAGELPMPEFDPGLEEKARRDIDAANDKISGKGMDFAGDYQFSSMEFPPPSPPSALTAPIQPQYLNNSPPQAVYPTPPTPYDQTFNPAPYPGQKHHLSQSPTTTTTAAAAAAAAASASTTTTTNPPASSAPESPAARLAAEEDKRRRNTAASARFRVKKKQREQALEQTAKDLENRNVQLEQRIGRLETENEWLRGLVVEKNGGAKEDLRVRWERYGGDAGEREGGAAKKGVGTVGVEEAGESA